MRNPIARILLALLVLLTALSFKAAAQTPTPTPTPPLPDRNRGVFLMLRNGGMNGTIPSPFPPHTRGVFASASWAQVEPKKGVFDWSPFTVLENQLPPGMTMQVVIVVGAYGSPTTSAACNSFRGKAIPGCSAWLGSVPGVRVHTTTGPNGASSYPACTILLDPSPAAPLYQSAWKGLVDAFEKQFRGDRKIAMVTLQPMSDLGYNLSLSTTNSSNVSVCSPEYYNQQWNKVSGCKGNESCWQNYVENAFNTLWSYEVGHLPDQNVAAWNASFPFPNITSTDGGYDFDIRNAVLAYAGTHHPTGGGRYSLANEALQASKSWTNAIARWSSTADNLGAQMARSNADNCPTLKTSGIDYGANLGANWIEIYQPDFDTCPDEVGQISAALGGNLLK